MAEDNSNIWTYIVTNTTLEITSGFNLKKLSIQAYASNGSDITIQGNLSVANLAPVAVPYSAGEGITLDVNEPQSVLVGITIVVPSGCSAKLVGMRF